MSKEVSDVNANIQFSLISKQLASAPGNMVLNMVLQE